MWDEQEHFARVVSKIFTWLLAAIGIVLTAASLATGSPDFFLTCLQIIALLSAVVLAYGLAAASVGGALLGITCGANYCLRWLRHHFFDQPDG